MPCCAQAPRHPPCSWTGRGTPRVSPPEGLELPGCLWESLGGASALGASSPFALQPWGGISASGGDCRGDHKGQSEGVPQPGLHSVAGVGTILEREPLSLPGNSVPWGCAWFLCPEPEAWKHREPWSWLCPCGDRALSWACRGAAYKGGRKGCNQMGCSSSASTRCAATRQQFLGPLSPT